MQDGRVGLACPVADVAASLDGRPIALVTHSTTQAVNALLEGDVGTVGVIGMGRRPDLRKSRKRTTLDHVELAPGKQLRTLCEFVDVSAGLDRGAPDGGLGVVSGHTTVAFALYAILAHQSAHPLLFSRKSVNDWVG